MKTYLYPVRWMLWLWLGVWASADSVLETAQKEQLLLALTGSPRRHWIESGTIKARHLEYRRADEFFAQSEEIVSFDGSRYRWEITLDAEETADEEGGQASSAAGERRGRGVPDKAVNRKRIFCWDGQQYTRYYPRAEYAVVSSNAQEPSSVLLGPLSAGIVPWGYGDWQIQTLLSRQISASQTLQDGQTVIRLEVINPTITPALRNVFILDPEKNYAVLSFVMENDAAMIENVYSDYTYPAGRWIPRKIRTERYLKTPEGRELISYDDWEFTEIQAAAPSTEPFEVPLRNGTLVEMHPGGGRKSFLYHVSDRADISGLLEEKLSIGTSSSDQRRRNCASAAVGLLFKRFSRPVPAEETASQTSEESGLTSLYEIKQDLEEAGLYCLAVRTDLDLLGSLTGCAIIAHLPNLSHYVIVDRIEEDAVWTIDLNSRKFYWKWKRADFAADWKEGTALLVSDEPTRLPTGLQILAPARLYEIYGGDDKTYSCTEIIQESEYIPCPEPVGGFLCGGTCYMFQERYGCVEDETGGTCVGIGMNGHLISPCKNQPDKQGSCIESSWYTGMMRACK